MARTTLRKLNGTEYPAITEYETSTLRVLISALSTAEGNVPLAVADGYEVWQHVVTIANI